MSAAATAALFGVILSIVISQVIPTQEPHTDTVSHTPLRIDFDLSQRADRAKRLYRTQAFGDKGAAALCMKVYRQGIRFIASG